MHLRQNSVSVGSFTHQEELGPDEFKDLLEASFTGQRAPQGDFSPLLDWFSQFTDIKRKDFLITFVHHLATIGLITFSYINNMVRVGTLVLCLHDVSDFLLEAAKLANYAKYQRLCDTLFVIFSAVFAVTRLGIYPFWILNTTLFESWEMIGPYPSWWLFNGLLLVLQVLHVIWSYLIARIAFKALIRGKVLKDDRSDVESSSEEEDITTNSKGPCGRSSSNGANRVNGHMGGSYWAEE
ncbi:hypothetical protein R6Z07F_018362 [Ovis aries]